MTWNEFAALQAAVNVRSFLAAFDTVRASDGGSDLVGSVVVDGRVFQLRKCDLDMVVQAAFRNVLSGGS